jgi:hypothetical protein
VADVVDFVEDDHDGAAEGIEVEETLDGEIERLIDHILANIDDRIVTIDDSQPGDRVVIADGAGRTIRSILAEEFEIPSEDVTSHLRAGDRLAKLNQAVDAIEESEDIDKGDDYTRVIFRSLSTTIDSPSWSVFS